MPSYRHVHAISRETHSSSLAKLALRYSFLNLEIFSNGNFFGTDGLTCLCKGADCQNLLYPFARPLKAPLFFFQERLVATGINEQPWQKQIALRKNSCRLQHRRRSRYRLPLQMPYLHFLFDRDGIAINGTAGIY